MTLRYGGLLTFALAPMVSSVAFAQDVATIVLLQGQVTVRISGADLPAAVGMRLDRNALVITAESAALILALDNHHLVRIDEDLALRVSDIVMLDAPEVPIDDGTLLSSLIYPDEVELLAAYQLNEGIAGYYARESAGAVMASEAEAYYLPQAEPEPEVAEKASDDAAVYDFEDDVATGTLADDISRGPPPASAAAGPSAPGSPFTSSRRDAAPRELAKEALEESDDDEMVVTETLSSSPPSPKTQSAGARPAKKGRKQTEKRKPKARKPPNAKADNIAADETAAPNSTLADEFSAPGPLRICLVAWANALPVSPDGFHFELRTDDNQLIHRIRVDQGLAAPQCAHDLLIGRHITSPAESLHFDFSVD